MTDASTINVDNALMSGVMLKTAIYGLLRVSFDLLGSPIWWWGVVALGVGLVTALFGVLYMPRRQDRHRPIRQSSQCRLVHLLCPDRKA